MYDILIHICYLQGPEFRKFLLTKLLNAELAALKSAEFSKLAVSILTLTIDKTK
jgi:hypothetical protein